MLRKSLSWLRRLLEGSKRRAPTSSDLPQEPRQILLEWSIIERVFCHFEGRKKIWETRGIEGEYKIRHYYEFGVYNGDTLCDFYNCMSRFHGGNAPPYWQMVGFDSFEGLPATHVEEDLHPQAGEGSYKSDGVEFVQSRLQGIGCGPDRLRLVKGFYQESLSKALRDKLLAEDLRPSFVNIDCDYYSSTMTVLNWIEPLLMDGTVVYFDDIYFYNCNPNKGELKAIDDFNRSRDESGLALAPWFDQGARCYLYWRNEAIEPHKFEFKKYITG